MDKTLDLAKQMALEKNPEFFDEGQKLAARHLRLTAPSESDSVEDYFKQFNAQRLPEQGDLDALFNTIDTPLNRRIVLMLSLNYPPKVIMQKLGVSGHKVGTLRKARLTMVFCLLHECVQLETEDEKLAFLENMASFKLDSSKLSSVTNLADMSRSPSKQLEHMARSFKGSGDDKRKMLRQLIAYGMQTRVVEPAKIDAMTGRVVEEAVVQLCDPDKAFRALQELNRMDHEYHDDDKASSSIETQEERIERLKSEAVEFRKMQRKALDESTSAQARQAKAAKVMEQKR